MVSQLLVKSSTAAGSRPPLIRWTAVMSKGDQCRGNAIPAFGKWTMGWAARCAWPNGGGATSRVGDPCLDSGGGEGVQDTLPALFPLPHG